MPCVTENSDISVKSEVNESSEDPSLHSQVADGKNIDKVSEEGSNPIVIKVEPGVSSQPIKDEYIKQTENVNDEDLSQADAKGEDVLQSDRQGPSLKKESVGVINEYEQMILRNIREKEKMFAEIFKGVDMEGLTRPPKEKRARKKTVEILLPKRHLPRRSASKAASERLASESFVDGDDEIVNFSDEDEDTIVNGRKRKLIVAYRPRARNSSLPSEPRVILSAEEITEAHLCKVADIVTEKVYTQNGTTCHQCRQKTDDMKTICRSENCTGIRGYFCGPCLRNRYGEDVRAALKNPTWKCPPCRDICNCSICRNRAGARPTGILTPIAKRSGYTSVKDYLIDHDNYMIKYEDD